MKNMLKQNHKKKVLLRKALSLVIAAMIAAGIPGEVYTGISAVAINAAQTDDSGTENTGAAVEDPEASDAESADILEDMDEQAEVEEEIFDEIESSPDAEDPEKSDNNANDAEEKPEHVGTDEEPGGEENREPAPRTDGEEQNHDRDELETEKAPGDAALPDPEVEPAQEVSGTEEEAAFLEGELVAEVDGVTVTAEFTESAVLPVGTELQVRKISPDEKLYDERYAWAQEWVESRLGKYVISDEPDTNEEDGAAPDDSAEGAAEGDKKSESENKKTASGESASGEKSDTDIGAEKEEGDEAAPEKTEETAGAEDAAAATGEAARETTAEESAEAGEGTAEETVDSLETTAEASEDAEGAEERTKKVELIPPTEGMTDEEAVVLPDLEGAEIGAFALFDISFVYEGEEIEPQDLVRVTLSFSQEDFAEEENLALIHYGEVIEVVPEQMFSSNRKGEVEGRFTTGAFSEYAVMALKAPVLAVFDKEESGGETAGETAEGKTEDSAEKTEDKKEEEEEQKKKEGFLKDGELTAEVDGVVVTVKFTEAAGLPEGTELRVRKIDPEEKSYTERIDSAKEWVDAKYGNSVPAQENNVPAGGSDEEENAADSSPEGLEEDTEDSGQESEVPADEEPADTAPEKPAVGGMTEEEAAVLPEVPETKTAEIAAFALFDIALVCDGKEIEPQESVRVTLRFAGDEFSEKPDPVVIHYAEEEKTETKNIEIAPEQEVKSSEDGSVEASFSADSFSEYAVMAVRATYTVWFDGTLGMGTTRSLVKGATDRSQTVSGSGNTATVTLPTSAGNNVQKYKLNGWYDIYTGQYYKPGATATITRNTVFYAEWVQADYDLGPKGNVVAGQPDISSFVTTKVFDYNEIFNPYHGAGLTNASWVNNGGHYEMWRDSQNTSDGGDFLFTNWYHQYYENNGRYLGFVSNLLNGRNRYAGAGDITSNIVNSPDDELMTALFGESDTPGKVYLGDGDMLYQYDNNPSSNRYGYYYYDSDKNAADYNAHDQRFYVYQNTQTIRGEWNDYGTNVTGFMPFEEGTSTINQKTGQVNFWFGMNSTVNFFLPDDPGSGGNKAAGGKDMEFYFSGDDDVWVFVDDILLLDLGGIHRKINGSINFSDGNIYVEGRRVAGIPDSIRSGDHQLRFYYLERGSSWSNASIYFNIAPRYSMELVKSDADDPSQLLQGAVFNVYADAGCTIPAYLWTSKEAYDSGAASVNTFTTGADGKVGCYGLYANRTYYLKEISAPPGYPSIAGRVIALKLNAYGDAAISDGADIASLTQDGATKKIDLSVTNELPEEIDIPVQKHWYNQNGSLMNGEGEIEVELYQAEIDIPTGGGGGSGGGSGANTGAVLPVNIRTQFFRVNEQMNNGSNTDTSELHEGDLTSSAIVTQGGSLTLTLDVSASNAGVYSVVVNGRTIAPESTSNPTPQNCLIGGNWGNHPPRHAVYVIDPVEEALDIRVTLIGYLNYGGEPHHPDTSYSMSITTATTEPAADPGTGGEDPEEPGEPGEPQGPEIPSVMPEDATLYGTATLSAADNGHGSWRHVFTGLPARNPEGTKLYVYYVKEIYPDGYSTSYTGNGSIGGDISIYNVRLREISVKKEWEDFNGTPLTEGLPESIALTLTQYDETAGTSRVIPVTLTAADGWQKRWRSNSNELNEQEGHSYSYKVTEVNVSTDYTVTYSENNLEGITEGTIIVTNRRKAYSVPFVKADSTDHGIMLSGATFSIYSDPGCEDAHIVEAFDSDSETAEAKTVFTSGENGAFEIYGLRAGTYYLKELSAPSGYYLINYPLEIVITDTAGGIASVRGVRLVDGELTEVQEEIPRIEIVQGSILKVHIYDSPLYELPSTGGPGSWLFIVGGIAVMLAALLLNIKRCNDSGLL